MRVVALLTILALSQAFLPAAGAQVAPINPGFTDPEVMRAFRDAEPRIIICRADWSQRARGLAKDAGAAHVVVLGEFFKELPAVAWLLSSAVAVGGVFWAWLYDRTGSLLGPWFSHLIIDAGIFWVGYELIGDKLSAGA